MGTRHDGVREDAAMLLLGDCCPPTPAAHDIPAADMSTVEVFPDEPTAKPHHVAPPAYTPTPYLDSPPIPRNHSPPVALDTPQPRVQQQSLTFHHVPSADYVPAYPSPARPSFSSSDDNDNENVPFARLLPPPLDAPPAYSSVVRLSYRETLQQHIPRCTPAAVDEEAALERVCADELAFEVERAVAMAVVMALMMLAGVLVGLLFFRKGA